MERTLLGTQQQSEILVALYLLEESYASELVRITGASKLSVSNLLDALEEYGAIVSRVVGRQRRYQYNRRYFASSELMSLLAKLAVRERAVTEAVEGLRRRPRKRGKPI